MPFTIGGDRIPPKNDQRPHKKILVREQKKKGKYVTLVLNINLDAEKLKALFRYLKKQCHCGGALRDHSIEIQGQKEQEILKALKEYPDGDLNL